MFDPYLLTPMVKVRIIEMVTLAQLERLLAGIRKRKFGAKEVAVDVEEVITTGPVSVENQLGERILLPAGTYFNVHVEYLIWV